MTGRFSSKPRLIYAQIPPAEEIHALRDLPGVVHVEKEGCIVRLRIDGDARAVAVRVQAS